MVANCLPSWGIELARREGLVDDENAISTQWSS